MTASPSRPAADPPRSTTAALSRVGRGSALNLAGTAVGAATTFVLTAVVTRGLTAQHAGVFFSATSLFLMAVTVGQLGTPTGLVYFIGRCRALGTPHLIPRYLRQAMVPVVAVALLAAVALSLLAPRLAAWTLPGHVDLAASSFRVLAVLLPFAAVSQVYLAAARGLATMRPNALVELIGRPVAQLVLVALAALAAPGLLTWAWALPYVPAALVAWIWWRRLAARAVRVPATATEAATHAAGQAAGHGSFWRFTWPRAVTSVVQIAMQRLDIVLLGALAGPAQAAVYTAATRFVVAGQMGNNAVSLAAQPALAESLAVGDRARTQRIYQLSTAWLITVTWPLFLLFASFGSLFLQAFGDGYGRGRPVLVLLSLTMLIATGLGMVDMVLAMAGHTGWNLINAVVALAVQVGLDLWLIPDHGMVGAAVGWAAAIVSRNVVAAVLVGSALRLRPFGTATLLAAILNVVCFLAVPLAVRSVLGETWAALAVAVAAGGGLFFLGVWWLREWLELKALMNHR